MQEWYILGVGKGVLFREVSSVQECLCTATFYHQHLVGSYDKPSGWLLLPSQDSSPTATLPYLSLLQITVIFHTYIV